MNTNHTPTPAEIARGLMAKDDSLTVGRAMEQAYRTAYGNERTAKNELIRRAKDYTALTARVAELEAALRAIIKITDGSQPKDYPGALMVARAALAQS